MDNRNSIEGGSTSKGRIASRDLDGINSAPPEFDPQKGKLHVLTIGVSRYKAGFNLTEPEKDATDLAAAFARQQSAFFQTSPPITLLNEKATKDAILVALDDLQREATVDDLVVVTLAGHGKVDERNRFFFLPYDYDPDKKLPTSSVSWDDFVWVLKSLPCMTLVIADTCHSGAITQFGFRDPDDSMKEVVDNAVNDFKQSPKGVIIFAACLRQSKALEHPKWHHGALSLAVLEAVTGVREFHAAHDTPLPVPNEQGLVTLESIRSYVIDRVKKLTEGRQDVVDNNSGNIHLAKVPIAIRTSPAVTPTKGKGGTVKDEE